MPKPTPDSVQGQSIWFNSDIVELVTPEWFEPEYWQQQGCLTGSAAGRGTTYFFNHQQHDLVLRHYKRGGLIGKVLNDQYWFTGLNRTRAWRELSLLLRLNEFQLPAPKPVAARVKKCLGYYTADLITEKISNAQDAHQVLLQTAISTKTWQLIGKTIGLFHAHQVYHHDLNIHNIMLDEQEKVWLIDFDKCAIKAGQKWKEQNIARLLRSLKKESTKIAQYHFSESDWQHLLVGYKNFN